MSTNVSKLTSAPLPDICRNKHGGADTSEEANARIHSRKENDRQRVLRLAEARGSYGCTVHEVAAAFGVSENCVSGRLSELKASGQLVLSGEKRNKARVLVVPQKGQMSLI